MTTVTYHKSATKDVRPFFGAASLETALDRAEIRLFDDQQFTQAASFVIEEQDVRRLSITVRPKLDERLIGVGPVPRAKLILAITAFNPFLKRTISVSTTDLSGPPPEQVSIGPEVLDRLGGGLSMTVEVALCLAQQLPRKAGNPFLNGHWLCKKSFDLRPPKLSEDFDVDPTDDADWEAMNMPAKTLYYVEYYGGINEPVSRDRPLAKVRVHSDVFKKLSADSNQKLAKPLLAFLAAEIPCQILAASLSEWKDVEQPEPRSALSAFLKRINRVQACTVQELRRLVEEPGIQRLRGILHADQHCVRQVVEA